MSKIKVSIVLAFVAVIVVGACLGGLIGKNDDQNWQVKQSVTGNIEIIDRAGYYPKWFATITTYPRAVQEFFSADSREGSPSDESIRTTFNDGGTAQVSTMVRYQTPTLDEDRKKFHRDFSGNIDNASAAVRAHLVNSIKSTGPLMSASENQASRKSEFTDVVADQLSLGLFEMRRVERTLEQVDSDGKPIKVFATEIIVGKDGRPVIAQPSPLNEYGINVLQFSTTSIEYDKQTLQQFSAKKGSYLAAEKSKAQQEEEVQQRKMVEERGLREKAEVEAQANKEKAQATINAQKEKEVAETQAAKLLEVARLTKQTAETRAAQLLEVAKLEREAAEEQAAARKVLADAKKYELEQAGALSEELEAILNNNLRIAEVTANGMKDYKTPESVFIMSGGEGSEGTNLNDAMFNFRIYQDIRKETMTRLPTSVVNN